MTIFGGFGAPAWSRMFKYFELRYGQVATDERVLVSPVATNSAWDDRVQPLRFMEMNKWGDWIPSVAWQYAPNSGRTISSGYQYFLNSAWVNLIAKNGSLTASVKMALTNAGDEVTFTRAQYNKTVDDAAKAYDNHVRTTTPKERKTKRAFFHDQGWDEQIKTTQKRLKTALETFSTLSKNINDPDIQLLKRAQIKIENPKQKIWLPPTRDVVGDRDRWQQYFISLLGNDIDAFMKERNFDTEHVREVEQVSTFFEQKWKASVSVSFLGLFRAGGLSVEQVRRETHIKNNATDIDISFTNIGLFDVVRGEWFDENVVSRFKDIVDYNTIWGPNGQLELIPKSLLVGRGMKFTVYADSNSLDYLYEHFEASADAGFFISYWRVGVEGSYSSTKSETKVYRYKDRIEFTDLSGRGKVLAVLCKYYAASVPKKYKLEELTVDQSAEARREIDEIWGEPALLKQIYDKTDPEIAADIIRHGEVEVEGPE